MALESDSDPTADTSAYARTPANGYAESWTRPWSIASKILPHLHIFDGKDRIGIVDVVKPLRSHAGYFPDNRHAWPLSQCGEIQKFFL